MDENALSIVKVLTSAGYQALYAGGYVRDFLLGIPSNDIDIATNATPDIVESLFPKTLAIGKAFGVILVLINDQEYEVATFRADGNSSDGRHPDSVTYSSIEEDSKRRDLTINGMYFNPLTNEIIDLVGGLNDLRAKVVRYIGDPTQRIMEDKLRLMRACRFASRLEFEIDSESYKAIFDNASLINEVSVERIGEELIKILSVKNKRRGLELLFECGLLRYILPEVILMRGCEQPVDYHPEGARVKKIGQDEFEDFDLKNSEHKDPSKYKLFPGDVWEHTLKALEQLPENASPELLMATLLHDVGKPPTQTFKERIRFDGHDFVGARIATEILQRLKFSNEFIDHVVSMIANHMKFMHVQKMRTSKLKRFMNLPKFNEHLELHKADCMSSHEDLENYNFIVEKLKSFEAEPEKNVIAKLPRLVTGHDLISMGLKPGPKFREILTDVEDQQLEEILTTRQEILDYITKNYLPYVGG